MSSTLSPPASYRPTLTPRQLDVVRLIGSGHTTSQIARRLGIGLHTAKSHVLNARDALGARDRAMVIMAAMYYEFISPEEVAARMEQLRHRAVGPPSSTNESEDEE